MCGIAGIVGPAAAEREPMARMLAALSHRGPDDEGRFDGGLAVLGHRRLSIIDLGSGHQPLHDAARKLFLVANGEIYNYLELRAELRQRGHTFLTNSDCEVILHGYREWGVDCLKRLRGMFAFLLWDTERRVLFAARDHLGQKPLFYAEHGGNVAFASEIKGLLAFEPALRKLNLEGLDEYFALRLIAAPRTMFAGVRKLPPGHALLVEEGRCKEWRYWDLSYKPKLAGSDEELTDALEQQVIESVKLHLASDVPVGAFLSGGMDSSLLVAMIVRHGGLARLPTFTLSVPHQGYDEAPFARQVAELFGTEHHEGTLRLNLAQSLPKLVQHLDEPSDPLALCTYELAEYTRGFVKCVIGGDGGDELFGGYDRYYGNLYADRYARIPSVLREGVIGPLLRLVPTGGWYKSKGHQLRWLQQMAQSSGGARYASSLTYFYFGAAARHSLFTPAARERLGAFEAEACIREPYDRIDAEPLDRMLYADAQIRMPDHPVMISDRMSMAHGLEVRSPFMDHVLAEFAARLPCDVKVRGRSLRVIQKKLAARYLPDSLMNRPKQGFAVAMPYLLRDEYRKLYRALLPDARLVADGIVRREPVAAMIQEHLSGRADHGNRLWLLLNAEVWYRMNVHQVPVAELTEQCQGRSPEAA